MLGIFCLNLSFNTYFMSVLRITKEFRFEGAHALSGYDGKCRNIHGHSYLLYITVKGKVLMGTNSPKEGMVVDFKELKTDTAIRVLDMLCGAIYALDGGVYEMEKNIFMFSPNGVEMN